MTDDHGHASRKSKPLEGLPLERRQLLGRLLEERRGSLGYPYRPGFREARNVHDRMSGDIEKAARDTFAEAQLANIARAYEVTYDSMLAVARGEADRLEPVPGPAAPPRVDLSGEPVDGDLREAIQDDVDAMHAHLLDVVAKTRNPDPPGSAVFADPLEAAMWDRLRRQFPSPLRRLVIIAGSAVPREGQPGRRHGSAAGLSRPGNAGSAA